jgi:hypothetical protein
MSAIKVSLGCEADMSRPGENASCIRFVPLGKSLPNSLSGNGFNVSDIAQTKLDRRA